MFTENLSCNKFKVLALNYTNLPYCNLNYEQFSEVFPVFHRANFCHNFRVLKKTFA